MPLLSQGHFPVSEWIIGIDMFSIWNSFYNILVPYLIKTIIVGKSKWKLLELFVPHVQLKREREGGKIKEKGERKRSILAELREMAEIIDIFECLSK